MVKDVTLINALDDYEQLDFHYDKNNDSLWYYMKARPRPCFNVPLLEEIARFQSYVKSIADKSGNNDCPRFLVLASSVSDIFNLGGDLHLFKKLIYNKDRDGLVDYASLCIKVLYQNRTRLGLPLTTIALVKGSALGGGLEAALSCDVIVAEKGVKMGFPEILFNLFPGMGAFSLLSRKLDALRAEKLIVSGRLYDASELYEMGVVDYLAEKGQGEKMVADYIRHHNKFRNGLKGIRQAKEQVFPLPYEELHNITNIWVNTALQLEDKDIKMMDRLVRSQDRLYQTVLAPQDSDDIKCTNNGDNNGFKPLSARKRQPYLHSVRVDSRKEEEVY